MRRLRAQVLFALLLAAALPAVAAGSLKPEYKETKELMALVEQAAALIGEKGVEAACDDFGVLDSRWLFDDVYVFVIDLEGTTLCHPARRDLEGKVLLELRDPAGKPIIANLLRDLAGGADDAWEHYLWPRPGSGTFVWKSTYVRRARTPGGEEVMVGSGLYQMRMERFLIADKVEDAADLIETLGELAFETLRDKASGFRFYDAYVFVMDSSGVHLVNAGFPEYEGKSMINWKDSEGKAIGREMLALLAKQEAGWVDYMWPKPGETVPVHKSSYVRRVELDGKLLVVGGGLYPEE